MDLLRTKKPQENINFAGKQSFFGFFLCVIFLHHKILNFKEDATRLPHKQKYEPEKCTVRCISGVTKHKTYLLHW